MMELVHVLINRHWYQLHALQECTDDYASLVTTQARETAEVEVIAPSNVYGHARNSSLPTAMLTRIDSNNVPYSFILHFFAPDADEQVIKKYIENNNIEKLADRIYKGPKNQTLALLSDHELTLLNKPENDNTENLGKKIQEIIVVPAFSKIKKDQAFTIDIVQKSVTETVTLFFGKPSDLSQILALLPPSTLQDLALQKLTVQPIEYTKAQNIIDGTGTGWLQRQWHHLLYPSNLDAVKNVETIRDRVDSATADQIRNLEKVACLESIITSLILTIIMLIAAGVLL